MGREVEVFSSFIKDLKALLVAEKLTNKVSNALFQNQGIISLEAVLSFKAEENEEEAAQSLLTLLNQVILEDSGQFEKIAKELGSFEGLKSTVERMTVKWWKDIRFILKLLEKVPYERNHRLGIELELSVSALNAIEVDNKDNSERIRIAIVDAWLKGDSANISLGFLRKVASKLSHPLYSRLHSSSGIFLLVLVLGIIVAMLMAGSALGAWGYGSNFILRNNSQYHGYDPELRRGIEHLSKTLIRGSIRYITQLPQHNKKVFGREEKVKKIIEHIVSYNLSIAIVGKPGFGKSTLAKYAGHALKNKEGLDVFMADTDEHFSDRLRNHEIRYFYDAISEWSEERNKKTVLILDNFDKFLTTTERKKLFQDKFLKTMFSYAHKISLIITTQIEISNENFRLVRADEIERSASIQLLQHGNLKLTEAEYNDVAEVVDDCPLALKILIPILDDYRGKNMVGGFIEKLNSSKTERKLNKKLEEYADYMQIAYDHLESSSQCCGCCISHYPGSFSEKLLNVAALERDVPCSGAFFEECVDKLVRNSLLDQYDLEGETRYKMHSLIQSYFHSVESSTDCSHWYRYMFSLFFVKYCALPRLYSTGEEERSTRVLLSDYHHFQTLLREIKYSGSRDKYEAAVLVIAHERGEIKSVSDYKVLYKAVCQCEECVHYVRESIGNEGFGQIVMNVSEKIHGYNFLRCEYVTDNFCSTSLLYNPPSNFSTAYNYEVLNITCTCYLMHYYHIYGTVGILGTLPFLLIYNHRVLRVDIDITTVVFVYLSFLPSIIKLYFGAEIEKVWQNIYKDSSSQYSWEFTFFAQLIYEFVVIVFAGRMFQQKEVLYAVAAPRIKNIIMLLILMGLPLAILLADLQGVYTIAAAQWNVGVLLLLLVSRYWIFDYVTKKISNGILLRLFFRLILTILNLTSGISCRYIISASFETYFIFSIGSVLYIIVIARSTAALLSFLDIL